MRKAALFERRQPGAHLAEHADGGKGHAQDDPGSGLDEASVLGTVPALEVQVEVASQGCHSQHLHSVQFGCTANVLAQPALEVQVEVASQGCQSQHLHNMQFACTATVLAQQEPSERCRTLQRSCIPKPLARALKNPCTQRPHCRKLEHLQACLEVR